MSLVRAVLATVQAGCYQVALTPPNPVPPSLTPSASLSVPTDEVSEAAAGKDEEQRREPLTPKRYHTEAHPALRAATFVFMAQRYVFWTCTVFEILAYARTLLARPLPTLAETVLCPSSSSPWSWSPSSSSTSGIRGIHWTPVFGAGVLAVILGTWVRLDCFRTLGRLFTFDLTVCAAHRLVRERGYAWVRHPAYTGSMLLVLGLALAHLTRGSWVVACVLGGGVDTGVGGGLLARAMPFGRGEWIGVGICFVWGVWTVSVGVSRARAEDGEMRRVFGEEWDEWADRVRWWFLPGVL